MLSKAHQKQKYFRDDVLLPKRSNNKTIHHNLPQSVQKMIEEYPGDGGLSLACTNSTIVTLTSGLEVSRYLDGR